jgi:hypothetical protein
MSRLDRTAYRTIGDRTVTLEDAGPDVVYMKVVSEGSYSYDTQAGGNSTVPQFRVVSTSRKGSC